MRTPLRFALLALTLACAGCLCAEPEPQAPPPAKQGEAKAAPAAKESAQAAPKLSEERKWPGINFVYQQEGWFFTGQPSQEGFQHAKKQGVKTVINLRDDDLKSTGFDEAGYVKGLGLTYRHVPISGKRFTPEDVATFGKLLAESEGPVLIHCRSGNRVGALWAAHLVREGRIRQEQAVEHGKAAGLKREPTIERTREVSKQLAEK